MNGHGNIERVLDAWLVDGPSLMPDRLFDAVLDRVERTPQRRFARLQLRLTEMNPRIRIYTLAAASIVVAVVGLYLVGRARNDANVGGATPSPVTSPDPTHWPTLVPVALRHMWIGAPRGIPGLEPDAAVALSFDELGNFWMSQSNVDQTRRVQSKVEALQGDGFHLVTADTDADCESGDGGGYFWTLSASGQTLEVNQPGDGCETRQNAVPGTWWLMDCPTAEDNCLGTLDPGTYSSQFFDPFVGPGEPWSARFGALTYTVPEGWINVEDWPGYFTLNPAIAPDGAIVFLATDVVLSNQAEACSEVQDPALGTSAAEMTTWLSTADGLLASEVLPVSIGGLDGFSIDIALKQGWTETCPWSDGRPVRALLADSGPAEGFAWAIEQNHQARLIFLDVEDGRTMLIKVETPNLADFGGNAAQAATVINSFVFTP
jgi:hypothetical protein